jgi:hypothetical protein
MPVAAATCQGLEAFYGFAAIDRNDIPLKPDPTRE